jgi:hypothetical protein
MTRLQYFFVLLSGLNVLDRDQTLDFYQTDRPKSTLCQICSQKKVCSKVILSTLGEGDKCTTRKKSFCTSQLRPSHPVYSSQSKLDMTLMHQATPHAIDRSLNVEQFAKCRNCNQVHVLRIMNNLHILHIELIIHIENVCHFTT